MIEFLRKKGYGYSGGMLSPDSKQFIVNIPKNASSYISAWAKHNKWSTAEILTHPSQPQVTEVIVILRDPLQRWISGIGQYINSYVLNVTGAYDPRFGPGIHDLRLSGTEFISQYNQISERLLFDNLQYHDDHVWPQCDFFENLLPEVKRTYFFLDSNLDTALAQYLDLAPVANLYRNQGEDNEDTKQIQAFLKQRLELRPELVDRIRAAYDRDYELINSVEFYTIN